MYTCYVAIVTSYGMKKAGLKKTSQREILQKLRAIFFVGDLGVVTSYTFL